MEGPADLITDVVGGAGAEVDGRQRSHSAGAVETKPSSAIPPEWAISRVPPRVVAWKRGCDS
jgi:hypothetical protein